RGNKLQLLDQRVDVTADDVAVRCLGIERAILALMRAERHVNVEAGNGAGVWHRAEFATKAVETPALGGRALAPWWPCASASEIVERLVYELREVLKDRCVADHERRPGGDRAVKY